MSNLIRKIHVGCRQLGIDADTRHALQLQVTGKASLTDMSEAELKLVVNHLKGRGFTSKEGRRPAAKRADVRFVHVMWRLLGEAGVLHKPGRDGLNAFIRSRFESTWGAVPADVDMLQEHDKISDVIDALKAWCERSGIELEE